MMSPSPRTWTRSTPFIFVILFEIYGIQSQSDLCVWDRTNENSTHINGQYIYNANGDGYAFYEKIDAECANNTQYVYKEPNIWRIGPIFGSTTDYTATCADAINHDSPEDCQSWSVESISSFYISNDMIRCHSHYSNQHFTP